MNTRRKGESLAIRLVAAACLCLLPRVAPAGAGGHARPPDTLWETDGSGVTNVVFLPLTLLNSVAFDRLETLNLDDRRLSWTRIREKVLTSQQAATAGTPVCTYTIGGDVFNDASSPPPIFGLDLLAALPVVVDGEIERLVSGVTVEGEAATLYRVRVTRVLKGAVLVHAGDHVTFMERMGHGQIDGTEICTINPRYRPPRMGEEVVVGGHPDSGNVGNLDASEASVLFVDQGVVDRGKDEPANWRPLTLDALERILSPR